MVPFFFFVISLGWGISPALAGHSSRDWNTYWEEISPSQLPALTPEGDLPTFTLAVNRQIENCQEYSAGKFAHCASEADPVQLVCDVPVLEKLRDLAASSDGWSAFYTGAKKAFRWYRFKSAGSNEVQFTGYNAPLFEGTLAPDAQHPYPLYNRPSDLVSVKGLNGDMLWKKRLPDGSLVPYDDRKTIDVGRTLAGKGLEVAYMEFPSDILRLHIEGSGVFEVRMPGGGVKQYGVNFAGKNGLPFVSVFKYLRDKGVDKKYLTFPGLKQYFADFPDDMWPDLVTDPAYTFFSLSDEPPCGASRAYLTGGHSLAVDPSRFPLGSAGFFSAQRPVAGSDPNGTNAPSQPFSRFGFAQDTGGAIQGGHVDIYWGTDDYAELASNLMGSKGTLYMMKIAP